MLTHLVIGDVLLDEEWVGDVSRVCPEAPVPVLQRTGTVARPGGAANVALSLAALGARPALFGVIGREDAALFDAHRDGVAYALLQQDGPTTRRIRMRGPGQMLLRVDENAARPAQADVAEALRSCLQGRQFGVVVLSGYGRGVVGHEVARVVRELQPQAVVLADVKPGELAGIGPVSVLKPNLPEAVAMLAGRVHPGLAAQQPSVVAATAAAELVRTGQALAAVVTAGRDGAAYHSGAESGVVGGTSREAFDVCGAGDTVMASLACGVSLSLSLAEATGWAMDAAADVISRHGVVAPTPAGLLRARRARLGDTAGVTPAWLVSWAAAEARRRDAKVVLANGCFDGLHAGHMEMLRFARSKGDLLIVAMNDDASLAALKGPSRPIVDVAARLRDMWALPWADMVVLFDGDVPKLVKELRPDVLVKGYEERDRVVPGADEVLRYGGEVAFCPRFVPLRSSQMAAGT